MCREDNLVSCVQMQAWHTGSALAAAVTATFHRHGKLIGTVERGDKQRNHDRNQRLCTVGK